ncbi:hypothetical protein G6F59_017511 [Rhizopus arrhizus]|nr:hypothetical protein G6F59_017511 [Rhizopus arrhizus]
MAMVIKYHGQAGQAALVGFTLIAGFWADCCGVGDLHDQSCIDARNAVIGSSSQAMIERSSNRSAASSCIPGTSARCWPSVTICCLSNDAMALYIGWAGGCWPSRADSCAG